MGHRISRTEGTSLEPVLPTVGLEGMTLNPTKQVDDVLDLTRQHHNLLERHENGISTQFAWDFGILSVQCAASQNYYLLDELGSPVRLVDGIGSELDVFGYDEFGMPLHDIQNTNTSFSFTGYQFDPVSDTLFAQARQYDSKKGRFISQDTHWNPYNMIYGDTIRGIRNASLLPNPVAINQSNNLYIYCIGNPTNFIDLRGEDAIWMNDAQGAFRQGHASLLIQDSCGTWYHINFGPGDASDYGGNSWGIVTVEVADLPNNITIQNRQVTNSRTEYTSSERRSNSGIPTGLERYFDSDRDFYHYIEGDFTESLELARSYVENQPSYNLIGNNCAWFSLYILQASFESNSTTYNNINDRLWRNNIQFWNDSQTRRIIRPNSFTDTIEDLFPPRARLNLPFPFLLAIMTSSLITGENPIEQIKRTIGNLLFEQNSECSAD